MTTGWRKSTKIRDDQKDVGEVKKPSNNLKKYKSTKKSGEIRKPWRKSGENPLNNIYRIPENR